MDYLQPSLWRRIQRTNISQLHELCEFLELSQEDKKRLLAYPRFAINIPRRLAQKMQKGTLHDPIARQFLPLIDENDHSANFCQEPVQDPLFRLAPRTLQKYSQRALIITTSACAMHCRYCFRQNYHYSGSPIGFEADLSHLASDPTIEEVILSGGDPLSLSNEALFRLINSIEKIAHIKRIRIHTRFPIGIPERIDEEFLQRMGDIKLPVWAVIHVNHARELDQEILAALEKWRRQGASLLNQSVLLKGVNDDIDTLETLCRTLVNHSIMPYYLHSLDHVQGAMHYKVDQKIGLELVAQLRARLSGYGVPSYVQEIPGESSKTVIEDLHLFDETKTQQFKPTAQNAVTQLNQSQTLALLITSLNTTVAEKGIKVLR